MGSVAWGKWTMSVDGDAVVNLSVCLHMSAMVGI